MKSTETRKPYIMLKEAWGRAQSGMKKWVHPKRNTVKTRVFTCSSPWSSKCLHSQGHRRKSLQLLWRPLLDCYTFKNKQESQSQATWEVILPSFGIPFLGDNGKVCQEIRLWWWKVVSVVKEWKRYFSFSSVKYGELGSLLDILIFHIGVDIWLCIIFEYTSFGP